jgi:peptidoglycan/xylan/chitin deacetylase (PgdA/CDA1 family)
MNWREVHAVKQRYPSIHFGVHGAEHVDMTSQSEQVVQDEIVACKNEFERALGEVPIHFAYPYDRSNEASHSALRNHAFKSAMSSGKRFLHKAPVDPLQIARVDAPHNLGLLARWTIGAYCDFSGKVPGRP